MLEKYNVMVRNMNDNSIFHSILDELNNNGVEFYYDKFYVCNPTTGTALAFKDCPLDVIYKSFDIECISLNNDLVYKSKVDEKILDFICFNTLLHVDFEDQSSYRRIDRFIRKNLNKLFMM